MVDLWLIGIGTGNPEHVTGEARRALRAARTILLPRKGAGKDDLADVRRQILEESAATARVVEFDMPVRDERLPYRDRVLHWHDQIAERWTSALSGQEGPVALLVWGDPSLYDSTLRIAERLDPAPRLHVVPGITALQALTAAHAIPINRVGAPFVVTTGRRLRDHGWPGEADTVAVMLDGECSFKSLDPTGVSIWWGAYLGMENQILEAGPLAEVSDRIVERRDEARAAHGWIMDVYLLQKGDGP